MQRNELNTRPTYAGPLPSPSSAKSAAEAAAALYERAIPASNAISTANRAVQESQLSDVVMSSTLADRNAERQAANILNAFNEGITKSCFTNSLVRGKWIDRGTFLLGHRNKKPELAAFQPDAYIARVLTVDPSVTTEIIGTFKQSDLFFGAHGSYVLNVPVGHYAKAYSGNMPLLFGPGPHVIHDPTFIFDLKNGLITQSDLYIKHESISILRVPAGKIAKIWIGSDPILLEARQEPYVFNTPYFRIDPKSATDYFFDATEPCIVHGSIKRLMPHTGQVAVTYNNGRLEVIEPRSDNQPTVINSPAHEVSRQFLNTGIQTLVFPSEETKRQRRLDNPKASTDEITYEIFTTKDSLKVGVKLLVAYKIGDPRRAFSLLTDNEGILTHIENLATVDMGKAIQQCSSQDFMSFYQTKPVSGQSPYISDLNGAPVMHFQDVVKQQLSDDLREYGIELVRLNIETPKIIDPELARSMSAQAQKTAETSQQQSVMQQQYEIARRKAEQDAEVKKIAQEQANAAKISQAEAEFHSAEMKAKAMLIQAEAEKQAALLRGQQFLDNPKLFELEMLRLQMDALSRAQFVPPQMAALMTSGMAASPFTFFGASAAAAQQSRAANVIDLGVRQENQESEVRSLSK